MQMVSIFGSLKQGILICGRNAEIVYFNAAYGDYIGQDLETVKGKKITDYRMHAMIPKVLKSGEAIEGVIRREGNQEYFASVYPIIEEGIVKGSISIVTTLAQYKLKITCSNLTLEERVRQFERQEIEAAVLLHGGGVEGKKKAAKELGISLATLYNKLKM